MESEKQLPIWEKRLLNLTGEAIDRQFENPAVFQLELSAYINALAEQSQYKSCIEVGCELGTTSYLLKSFEEVYLIDINPLAIKLSKEAFQKRHVTKSSHIIADMFNMPFENGSFDVVFNAGVIEHFSKEERTNAIREYYRVTKSGGTMIIAFPNHHSFPYRLAYLIRYYTKRWPFPEELKIYDLKYELNKNNITEYSRVTMSKKSVFYWSGFFKPLQKTLIFLDKLFNFEGYLTVITVKKP